MTSEPKGDLALMWPGQFWFLVQPHVLGSWVSVYIIVVDLHCSGHVYEFSVTHITEGRKVGHRTVLVFK
jgi:hypothetical protein